MSWILLLIQLIPTVLKIWEAIRDLIRHEPAELRPVWRAELRKMAKRHVRELAVGMNAGGTSALGYLGAKDHITAEWQEILDELRSKHG